MAGLNNQVCGELDPRRAQISAVEIDQRNRSETKAPAALAARSKNSAGNASLCGAAQCRLLTKAVRTIEPLASARSGSVADSVLSRGPVRRTAASIFSGSFVAAITKIFFSEQPFKCAKNSFTSDDL
jgi:hypothetical protein